MSNTDKKQSKPILSQDMIFYFKYIKDRDEFFQSFEHKWKELKKFSVKDAWGLVEILSGVAKGMKNILSRSVSQHHELSTALASNMAVWEEQTIAQMDKFNPQDLSTSLSAYASLGIVPSAAFLKGWEKQTIAQMDKFNPQDLSTSLWAAAAIDSFSSENHTLKSFYRVLTPYIQNIDDFGDISKRQIRDADMWFSGDSNINTPLQREIRSSLEEGLLFAFIKAGYNTDDGSSLVSRFKQSIDFKVSKKNSSILVEVDGPTHYVRNQSGGIRHNGTTLFRSALLNKFAKDEIIVRVGYPELVRVLKDKNDKNGVFRNIFCKAVFDKFVGESPGVYSFELAGSDFKVIDLLKVNDSPPRARRGAAVHI